MNPEVRRRPPSLALRLTALFAVVAAVVFAGFGWVVIQAIEGHFEEQDEAEMNVIAQAVRQSLSAGSPLAVRPSLERRYADILVGHHSASLYIAARDGRRFFASPGPDLAGFVQVAGSGDERLITMWRHGAQAYRVLIVRIGWHQAARHDGYVAVIATAIDHHLRFLESFRRKLWLMIAGGMLIMGLMGWVAVRQGHAPLRRIVARIAEVSGSRLSARLAPDAVPVELAPLAVSVNDMLGRIEEAFHRLSNFSADIAHELRTPVTNLMTQTQVALSTARGIEEYREILYSNLEEFERMAQMVGDLLFLAQADNGLVKPQLTEVELAVEAQALFDYFEAWADERGVSLVLDGAARVPGDRAMLRRALSNLLSNAIRHTPPGGAVRVRLDWLDRGHAGVVIENPGDDIPPEHLPNLFDRFYRADPSRRRSDEGVGLGLAIVKSIVDNHGGQVAVTSALGTTRFEVRLPLVPPVG